MYYVVETEKTFEQAVADLEAAVKNNSFGVLGAHDIGATLRSKGVEFPHECKVIEVCNPVVAGNILAVDMSLNMALPCRISVYTEDGKTRIGMIKPEPMLTALSNDAVLAEIARDVQEKTIKIVNEAR